MKIYTNTFDLSRPSPHRFWVPPYSDFKFGIKLVNAGAEVQNDFTVAAGTTELTPDEDKIDGFTIFTAKSADTGFVEYTIDVADMVQKFKLVQIVTDSTVFEVGGEGGDVPADVATQSWVNSQISDFVEEDALTAYATKGELTAYAEKTELTAYAEKTDLTSYAEKTDLTAYYAKTETSSATELAEAFANVGGGAISAYDMSESPVWSKTQVAQAVENNTVLPQTIAKYTNNSVSVFNIVGAMTGSNWGEGDNSKKVVVGSQVTSIGDNCFYNSTTKYVVIPDSVTTISNKFMGYGYAYGDSSVVEVLDFGNTRTTVPTVSKGTYHAECLLKASRSAIAYVPDALYDTWIAASIWSGCASQIRKHSDLVAPSKVSNAPVNYAPPALNISPVYEYEWETLSASASQHPDTLYVVVPDNGFRPYTQVKYSDGTLSSYDIAGAVADMWTPTNKAEATDIVFGTKVKSIKYLACSSCAKLSSLQFPWTVADFGNETFKNNGALSSVTIPGTVKAINSDAFGSCSNLTDVTFEGRTMAEVQAMTSYSWGFQTGCVVHCIDGDIVL